MAQVNIDVAKQATSDEINSRIGFSDMELIEMGKNYTTVQFDNLAATETELLSISGEGAIAFLEIKTTSKTSIKVYLDEKILFDFSALSSSTSNVARFNFGLIYPNSGGSTLKLLDLHNFVNGFQVSSDSSVLYSPILPTFKNSLKIYGYATTSDSDNYIKVSYGFKG